MIKYDKLKNMKTEEKHFDFICPTCNANGMKKGVFNIKPIGTSWRPNEVDNSDLIDILSIKQYDSLPTLKDALILSLKRDNNNGISVYCTKCEKHISIFDKITLPSLRRWITKNIPFFLDLGKK